MRILQAELGRDRVFNLATTNPVEVLAQHRDVAGLRVVACGGDGTVNWVLSSIAKLRMSPQPKVGIIPLGTGNDTSRHFGWSHKLRDAKTVVTYLRRMRQATCPTRPFDRWSVLLSFPIQPAAARAAAANNAGNASSHNTEEESTSSATAGAVDNGEAATQQTLHSFLRRMPRLSAAENNATLAGAGITANSRTLASLSRANTSVNNNSHTAKAANSDDLTVAVVGASATQTAYGSTANNNNNTVTASAVASNAGAVSDGELHLQWTFNNYFSFGIDAEIMDSFHRHRETSPGCYCCRCCNMVWVGLFAPINCCSCKSRPLDLAVDYLTPSATNSNGNPNNNAGSDATATGPNSGTSVSALSGTGVSSASLVASASAPAPSPGSSLDAATAAAAASQFPASWSPAEGVDASSKKALVFLNLPSYAGGRDIWDSQTAQCKPSDAISEVVPPSSNDGLVEVLGFDGYNHMSATVMRVPGQRAARLGQVPGARVAVRSHTFVQLDGEAWEMDHGRIEVVRAPTVMMLVNQPGDKQGACCDC